MRIERVKQDALVSVEDAYAQVFGPPCLAFQLSKLVQHFYFGGIERAAQCAIQSRQRCAITLQKLAQRSFARFKTACQTARQSFLLHAGAQILMPAENAPDFESEFRQQ